MNSAWAAENLLRDIEANKISIGYYVAQGRWAASREVQLRCGCIEVGVTYGATVEEAVSGCMEYRPLFSSTCSCNEEEEHD